MPTAWGDRRKHRSKRKKRTSAINGAAAAAVDPHEEDRQQEERDAKKRTLGSPEQLSEEEEAMSSAPSSPICEPYIPDDEEYSVELYQAFEPLQQKIQEKIGRQMQMPTLNNFVPTSCLATDPQLLPVRQRGTKAVLSAAKFLLGLSSSSGGKPLLRCSGFWIDWDEESKTGMVLTTAHLIRSNQPDFDGKDEYDPNAKVMVHLLDETIVEARLLYYQAHYDIALFRVIVDHPIPLPSFNDKVQSAQEVFRLGRDENLNLRITHGRVEHLNPDLFQRYHFMFCCSGMDVNEYDDGGLVIDLDGKVVGMVNITSQGSFIPSSILLKCFDLWRKFGRIPRPHLGFKFLAIKLLDPLYIDKIWRKYNIDDGLIVNEVGDGSNAEMLGIRRGDIISCFNGEKLSSTFELLNSSSDFLPPAVGGKPLLRCSVFWIDWDEESKTGRVLTTAHLIRSNQPDFDGKDEYDPNAKVMVHLLDETIVEARLLYYQAHYDIALFRVIVDHPIPLPSFNDKVQSAQEVFWLGRDENLNLRITHGRVEHLNPDLFQRYHFMFCCSDTDVNEYDDGGLVIDLDGKVVGMVNITSQGPFIPSSILLKCLDLWRKFGRIPRPHLGFKFLAIKLLDPLYIDKIWRKYNIDDGLIVNEVGDGSNAEMLGIRRGDIISCFNGEKLSSTFELENLLLDICMEFDRANQPGAKVDVLIKVFNTRKSRWREFQLTANVSDHGEVVGRGASPLST